MQQVIYTSIAAPDVDGGEVFSIVSNAAVRNRDLGITGMLVIVEGRFFQAIEGPSESIETLLAAIEADKRHHSMRILRRREIEERQFAEWSMQRFKVRDRSAARRFFRELMASNDDASNVLRKFKVYAADEGGLAA